MEQMQHASPLGLRHWIVIAIVVVLIVSLIGLVRGPGVGARLMRQNPRPVESVSAT